MGKSQTAGLKFFLKFLFALLFFLPAVLYFGAKLNPAQAVAPCHLEYARQPPFSASQQVDLKFLFGTVEGSFKGHVNLLAKNGPPLDPWQPIQTLTVDLFAGGNPSSNPTFRLSADVVGFVLLSTAPMDYSFTGHVTNQSGQSIGVCDNILSFTVTSAPAAANCTVSITTAPAANEGGIPVFRPTFPITFKFEVTQNGRYHLDVFDQITQRFVIRAGELPWEFDFQQGQSPVRTRDFILPISKYLATGALVGVGRCNPSTGIPFIVGNPIEPGQSPPPGAMDPCQLIFLATVIPTNQPTSVRIANVERFRNYNVALRRVASPALIRLITKNSGNIPDPPNNFIEIEFPAEDFIIAGEHQWIASNADTGFPCTGSPITFIVKEFIERVRGKNPCVDTTGDGIPDECPTGLGNLATRMGPFAQQILSIGIGLAGGIALIFMVIGAIRFLTSSGDPQKLASGREIIVAALAGLLFLIFSVLILQFIGIDIIKIPGFAPT